MKIGNGSVDYLQRSDGIADNLGPLTANDPYSPTLGVLFVNEQDTGYIFAQILHTKTTTIKNRSEWMGPSDESEQDDPKCRQAKKHSASATRTWRCNLKGLTRAANDNVREIQAQPGSGLFCSSNVPSRVEDEPR